MAWSGRGSGRRDEVLARLAGRGAARSPRRVPTAAGSVSILSSLPPTPRSGSRSAGSDADPPPPLVFPPPPPAAPPAPASADFIGLGRVSLTVLDPSVAFARKRGGAWWLAVITPAFLLEGRDGSRSVVRAPPGCHVSLGYLPRRTPAEALEHVVELTRHSVLEWSSDPSLWSGTAIWVPHEHGSSLAIARDSPLYATFEVLSCSAFTNTGLRLRHPRDRTEFHVRLGPS